MIRNQTMWLFCLLGAAIAGAVDITAYSHAFPGPPPPPSAFSPPPPPPPGAWVFQPNQTLSFAKIDDALSVSLYLTILRSLLKAFPTACDIFSPTTNCTLFAPTDASFQALASYLGKSMDQLAANPVLTPMLYYHFVPNVSLNISDMGQGIAYQTILYDQQLTIDKKPDGNFVVPTGSPAARILVPDIVAAHSRVHVIRGPLIPSSLVSPLTGNPPPRIPVYVTPGP